MKKNQQLNHSDEFSLVTLAVELHTSCWSIEKCCLAQKAIIITYKTKQQLKLLLKENDLMLRKAGEDSETTQLFTSL